LYASNEFKAGLLSALHLGRIAKDPATAVARETHLDLTVISIVLIRIKLGLDLDQKGGGGRNMLILVGSAHGADRGRGKMTEQQSRSRSDKYSLVILLTSNNVNVDECSAVLRFLPSQNYEIDDARCWQSIVA
jgi:hypothetical protein